MKSGLTTNELKKGQRIILRNKWKATLMDNARGNTRIADVEGDYREMGSIYSHDIMFYTNSPGEEFYLYEVVHTPKQIELKNMVNDLIPANY